MLPLIHPISYKLSLSILVSGYKMSELSKNPHPPKETEPPEKPEPRTAGASTTKEDIFNKLSETPEDESSAANNDPGERRITIIEALKSRGSHWKRKSVDMLGLGRKDKDEKKNGDEDEASKTA